ncbi:MAG: FHA domain-containing protein [bacterium]
MPKLILKRKEEILKEFEFDDSKSIFSIGSDPENDLVIEDKRVSRKHLRIEYTNGNYYLEDRKSAFGTMLNGRPLLRRVQIVNGDDITLGDVNLLFENSSAPPKFDPDEDSEIEIIDENYLDKKFASSHNDSEANHRHHESIKTRGISAKTTSNNEFYEVEEMVEEPKTQMMDSELNHFANANNEQTFSLLAIYGPYLGKKFAIKAGDNRIGRDNTLNDIVIRHDEKGALDPSISRRHATLSYKNNRFFLIDKRSKTRTYVNQVKLEPTDQFVLEEGDEIEIVSDQKSTIFRLVSDSNHDMSPPKKSGVWWIRNNLKLGLVLSLFFGIITAGSFGLSCFNQMSLNKKPSQLKFIEETWYQNQTSNGVKVVDAEPTMTGIAAADLTGDHTVDVIFPTPTGSLLAVEGTTKKLVWEKENLRVLEGSPLVLTDLNANGLQDILVVGRDSRLRALDGSSGAEMWLSPILGDGLTGGPVVADLNGDGLKDILICTQNGKIHIGYSYINDIDWKTVESGMLLHSIPSAADLDSDGSSEAFIGTDAGHLLFIDGDRAEIEHTFNFAEDISKTTGSVIQDTRLGYPISFADLNDDENPDLIIGASNGNYLAIEAFSLNRIWQNELQSEPSVQTAFLGPCIGRIDDDEIEDAVLVTNQMIKIIKGSSNPENSNQTLWQYSISNDIFSTPASLADFNKDGAIDVMIGSTSGVIHILNGHDGKILSQINFGDNPAVSPLLLADLGGDGNLDILYMRKDRNIYKIQTNSPIGKNRVVWGQAFSNENNTSRYEYTAKESTARKMISVTFFVLFMSVISLTYFTRYNRIQIIQRNQNSEYT